MLRCNECEYSIGCTWTKGSDPSHLAKVLWPFVHPQPQEHIASCKKYREAIRSHTPTAIPIHHILQKYRETMALITRKEGNTKVKKITEGEGKSSKVQGQSDSVREGKGRTRGQSRRKGQEATKRCRHRHFGMCSHADLATFRFRCEIMTRQWQVVLKKRKAQRM